MTTFAPQRKPTLMAPIDNDPRLFLSQIWKDTHFDTGVLSIQANVPESCILDMLRYKPVPRLCAEEILATLTRMLRQQYNLENVLVKLVDTHHAK